MTSSCSLLHVAQTDEREFSMGDYEYNEPRWCPGCGDLSVLTSVQRLLTQEQMKPEDVVFVSGIGCSSRFPHYVKTYGFHGLHGRALPVASGIKLSRPDLEVFAIMGDGDCISIGAGHWIHATRYNMDMVALLLDNAVYGLTKMQTSPTTPTGFKTNTQPHGSFLPPLNPLAATLGVTNASFVAQTVEWAPAHLYATLQAAYQHKGFSFVRVLQRCPQYTNVLVEDFITNPAQVEMLVHDDGINVPELESVYEHRTWHDPKDLDMARRIAQDTSKVRIGVFYKDESHPRYEETRHLPAHTVEDKMKILEQELDKHAV